jgi:tRNA threonylcarbamoyl adenosine modification protein YeaZ
MFLGIDTCTRWLNLALVSEEGAVVGEFRESLATHTTRLAPEIRNLLERSGLAPRDLCAIGAVVGPGSFTGLRVGLAAAAGMSQALAVPTYGISSLEALARACSFEGRGLAILDARRSEVYAQGFTRTGEAVVAEGDALALDPSRIGAEGIAWAIGDGVPLIPRWSPETARISEVPNLAVPAARRARERRLAGDSPPPLLPLYVRPPDVREPGKTT